MPIVGVDHVQLAMPAGREAEAHISRFEWLRARPKDGRATLPVYMVFDVLELDGKDWRPEPLWKRRQVLEELVAKERMILPVRRLSSNGLKAWAQAAHKGYEGIVAKDPQSPYVGGRTLKWLKVKQPNYRVEERGWDPRNKSQSTRSPLWCKFDPLAVLPRPSQTIRPDEG